MITTALLWIIYQGIHGLLALTILNLADVTVNTNYTNAITTLQGYLGAVDKFLPIATLFSIIGLIVVIEIGLVTYKLVMWIIHRFNH